MAVMELWRRRDLEGTVKPEYIDGNFFTQDSVGNLVGVKCYKDGAEVALTGSVTGYCVLPSGETVSVAGTRSGNQASILVPQSALAYTGPLGITLKLIDGNTITTLMRIIVVVYRSKTDTVITPSSQIITDWANQISAALQEVEDASAAQDVKIADLKSAFDEVDEIVRGEPNYTVGYYITSGDVLTPDSGYNVSEYIPIDSGSTTFYYGAYSNKIVLIAYNSSKEKIDYWGGTNGAEHRVVTLPANTAYVRFAFNKGYTAKLMRGTTPQWEAEYSDGLDNRVISAEGELNFINESLFNYFPCKKLTLKQPYLKFSEDTSVSEKISVTPGKNINVYVGTHEDTIYMLFFSSGDVLVDNYAVSSKNDKRIVEVPQNASYMQFTFANGYYAKVVDQDSYDIIWHRNDITDQLADTQNTLNRLIEQPNAGLNYETGKKFLTNSTTPVDDNDLCVSNYIRVVVGHEYKVTSGKYSQALVILVYDNSKQMFDNFTIAANATFRMFTMPSNSAYIRFTFVNGYNANVLDYTTGEYVWSSIPESSSAIGPVKDYYFKHDYLKDKAVSILDYMRPAILKGDAFFWITDVHWYFNAKQSPSLIKYIHDNTGISMLFDGGDKANGYNCGVINNYLNALGNRLVFPVVGNHEFKNGATKSDVYAGGYLHLFNNVTWGSSGNLYYYVDNTEKKIRYIVLQGFEEEQSLNETIVYNNEQLQWIENVALNVGSGWTIVIITHMFCMGNDQTKVVSLPSSGSYKTLLDIIDAYSGNGTIACILQGHFHWDAHSQTNSGVPIIITTCDKYDLSYEQYLAPDTREPGTIYEQAFDVVVLDTEHRKINLIRIGNPINDSSLSDADSHEVRTFNY